LAMAGMSIWVIVDRSNDGKDVDTLLLGVLAIFVVGKTATTVTDIINRPEPPEPPPKPKAKLI